MSARSMLPAVATAGLLLFVPGAALAELAVVVTSKPIHSLVSSVMAGVGSPDLLVDGSTSPHSYAMKPSDARKVHNADVLFRVSEQLEPFTGKLVRSLPKSITVVSLAEAPGLKRLALREGGAFEAHDEHADEAEPQHHAGSNEHSTHDGIHDDEEARGHAEAYDPHVWLDPENANAIVHHIADVLAELAPDKAAMIKTNAEAEIARINALSNELARELAPLSGKPFMVYHDAHQYFEQRYGLSAVGAVTVNPEVPPSGSRLQELRQKIMSSGALCVFAEPYSNPRVVKVVTEGTGARTGTLDPEGTTLSPGPDLYAKLMRDLARNLKTCLANE